AGLVGEVLKRDALMLDQSLHCRTPKRALGPKMASPDLGLRLEPLRLVGPRRSRFNGPPAAPHRTHHRQRSSRRPSEPHFARRSAMTLQGSRRRAMQAALATTAAVTLPRAAEPAAPTESGDATITAAQVQAAVGRLDALIEDGMTKTAVPGTAVAVVHNDTV